MILRLLLFMIMHNVKVFITVFVLHIQNQSQAQYIQAYKAKGQRLQLMGVQLRSFL